MKQCQLQILKLPRRYGKLAFINVVPGYPKNNRDNDEKRSFKLGKI